LKRIKDIKIKPKLMTFFLLTGIVPVIILLFVSATNMNKALLKEAFGKLEAVQQIKAKQINSFLHERMGDVEVYANNSAVVAATERFCKAFTEEGIEGESWNQWDQSHGEKFAHYVEIYNYYDLFIITPEGEVAYTVSKESDLGADLVNGNLSNSGLAKAYNQGKTEVSFIDFSWYEPSSEAACFVSAPVLDDLGELVGVLAFQVSLKAINNIMQERTGMGETGETYLVGSDFRMRSDSYLDPENHSVKASFAGTIEKNGVKTHAITEAIAGRSNTEVIKDYLGHDVLSAYSPIDLPGTRWAVVAEIDIHEVEKPIQALVWQLILITLVIVVLIVIAAMMIANMISKPLLMGVNMAK